MLKDYWDLKYTECPKCGKRQKQYLTYFECKDSDCGYQEKEFIKVSKREQRIRPIIGDMVKYLLENEKDIDILPLIEFPEAATPDGEGICAGWYDPSNHTINIPRKAFYLPNREIIEDVAHETGHVPTVRYIPFFDTTGGHIPEWHNKYMEYRKKLYGKYSSFASEPDDEAIYTTGFSKKKYKEWFGYDLETFQYDPYEDD